MSSNKYLYEVMGHQELINAYKMAVEDLPGTGAAGRQWVAEAEAELLARLEGNKGITEIKKPKNYRIQELPGGALETEIIEVEKFHEILEGKRPQNIAATINFSVYKDILFNENGTINGREPDEGGLK